MKKIINYLGQLKGQKKLTKTQLYLSSFGVLLFLTLITFIPLLNSPLNKNQNINKSNAATTTFYVSDASGNDAWSGLLDAPNQTNTDGPFKTLARAQTAMRNSSTIKTTTIRAGTYSLAGTNISLNWQDAGETWIPYQNETVIIDGGSSGYIRGIGASNMTFEGLTFSNMGSDPNGLAMDFNDSGHTIRWNTFLNCKANCIGGGAFSNSVVDSNIINGADIGITIWYGASNNRITHNFIQNATEEGIIIATGAGDPPASNNLIDRNSLKNTCSANANGVGTDDCGSIYLQDTPHTSTGNQITNNFIDGNGGYTTQSTTLIDNWSKAIYLDWYASYVVVSGNICRGCGEFGFQNHGGDHDTITNNIFDLSSGGSETGFYQTISPSFGMNGNTFTNNIIYSSSAFNNPLWASGIAQTDAPLTNNTNLYYSATNAQIPNTVIPDTNPQYANPQFTNPSAGDYSIPASSAAYSLINWQTIPTDQGPLPNPFISPSPTNTPAPTLTPTPIASPTPTSTFTPTPSPAIDRTPPSVTITFPVNNSTVSRNSNVTITANASDNIGVIKVDFLINNSLKCTDTTSPYSCAWKVPNVKNAQYTLTAKAYDAAGNNASNSINVAAK